MWKAECKERSKDKKCGNEKLFMALKRGRAPGMAYTRNHMCAEAIYIMEKDLPGSFPPTPPQPFTYSTTFLPELQFVRDILAPRPTSLHNYLIYYHQLQSFVHFPSQGFTFNDYDSCFSGNLQRKYPIIATLRVMIYRQSCWVFGSSAE